MHPIRVMIVDDSAVVRQVVRHTLEQDPAIRVVGAASDPLFALTHMAREWPDVIVLDIEMPRMDGLTFLRKIMAERPTPVVICSSLAERGAAATLSALAAGAVAVITKPRLGIKPFLEDSSNDIIQAVKAAAHAHVRRPPRAEAAPTIGAASSSGLGDGAAMLRTTERIIAIGTSTGGTQALEAVLSQLPAVCPGIVVVQHMPEKFTAMFAERLDALCRLDVREARHGDHVRPGRVLVAPGGKHMVLARSGAHYVVEVVDGPLVNRHRPSVDALFRSCARFAGHNAVGVIMTGMGDDGARGLREMHDAGARTIAEDESSCVVFGMPREAIRLGAVDAVLPLERIAETLQQWTLSD